MYVYIHMHNYYLSIKVLTVWPNVTSVSNMFCKVGPNVPHVSNMFLIFGKLSQMFQTCV